MSTLPTDPLSVNLLFCLRKHGQCLDSDIAEEIGMPLLDVHSRFASLLASGEVIACKLTRFDKGKPVDAMLYRASGYFPPSAPGRKPKLPPT